MGLDLPAWYSTNRPRRCGRIRDHFPGHYDGRATHTHLLTHLNATLLLNKTLEVGTGSVAHIGQLFWNEVLRSAVEDTYPYNTNSQAITTNADDMWSVLQADSAYDPFPEYIYLGDDLDDGLFAWIQIGLNATADLVQYCGLPRGRRWLPEQRQCCGRRKWWWRS